jgi:hypothetical protein
MRSKSKKSTTPPMGCPFQLASRPGKRTGALFPFRDGLEAFRLAVARAGSDVNVPRDRSPIGSARGVGTRVAPSHSRGIS